MTGSVHVGYDLGRRGFQPFGVLDQCFVHLECRSKIMAVNDPFVGHYPHRHSSFIDYVVVRIYDFLALFVPNATNIEVVPKSYK